MVDKPASSAAPQQQEKNSPEAVQDGGAGRAPREVDIQQEAVDLRCDAPLPSTPLQRLLDPAQSLLGRETPWQGSAQGGLNLPAWNNFRTHAERVEPPDAQTLDLLPDQPLDPVKTQVLPVLGCDLSGGEMKIEAVEAAIAELSQPGPPQLTLDESVVAGLIQALYDALPTDLGTLENLLAGVQEIPEMTPSGNLIGRPQNVMPVPTPLIEDEQDAPAAPTPRQFLRGSADEATLRVTRESLGALLLGTPAHDAAHSLSVQAPLGTGEACFLRAQSALWAWRTHRQQNVQLHTDGPPSLGRNALIEQRIGLVTLLIGCRVTEMTEQASSWGFTMVSLSGQVLRSYETFLVKRQENNEVMFTCTSQQQIAAPSLAFLGPVHSALRRVMVQGYIRNMTDMSAKAGNWAED